MTYFRICNPINFVGLTDGLKLILSDDTIVNLYFTFNCTLNFYPIARGFLLKPFNCSGLLNDVKNLNFQLQ